MSDRTRPRCCRGVVAAAAALLVLTGCGTADTPEIAGSSQPTESGTTGTSSTPEPTQESAAVPGDDTEDSQPAKRRMDPTEQQRESRPVSDEVRARLVAAVDMLRTSPERRDGYDRDLFDHWTDTDGDGCDARDEVLLAENRRPGSSRVVGDGCRIDGGRWFSYYDIETTTDSSSFDIDHMVPLAEAWDSGARGWSPARREAFANDQGDPRSLVGVTASSNRSKSDRDPAEWLPDASRCRYITEYVAVKLRWDLAVDPAEETAIERFASQCGGRLTVRLATPGASPATSDGKQTNPLPERESPNRPDSPGSGGTASGGGAPSGGGTDPRFDTCGAATDAGFGDYVRGRDPEYGWYTDGDDDGTVCET